MAWWVKALAVSLRPKVNSQDPWKVGETKLHRSCPLMSRRVLQLVGYHHASHVSLTLNSEKLKTKKETAKSSHFHKEMFTGAHAP